MFVNGTQGNIWLTLFIIIIICFYLLGISQIDSTPKQDILDTWVSRAHQRKLYPHTELSSAGQNVSESPECNPQADLHLLIMSRFLSRHCLHFFLVDTLSALNSCSVKNLLLWHKRFIESYTVHLIHRITHFIFFFDSFISLIFLFDSYMVLVDHLFSCLILTCDSIT